MALTKVRTGGLTADSVDNTILDLADDFAFTGTVSGSGLDLIETQNITSAVSEVIFSNKISTTYKDYIVKGTYVNNTNNNLRFTLRQSGTEITNTSVYQSAHADRAGSSEYSGNGQNGTYSYAFMPMVNLNYGGTVVSFQVQFDNLYEGILSGTTSLEPHRLRWGRFDIQSQNVSSSDWFGTQGWFGYYQANGNENSVTAVTDIKVHVGSGNFERGYISLYGVAK